MISIITPVLNFDNSLKDLYKSIINQSYLEQFEWILIKESNYVYKRKEFVIKKKLKLVIIYSNKKNLYHAINKGIRDSTREYYIVIGQDDIFENGIFKIFLHNLSNHSDMHVYKTVLKYSAPIPLDNKKYFDNILYETNHSGGIIFAKKTHNLLGYYDENYKIASDQLFIKQLLKKLSYKKYHEKSAIIGNSGITSMNKKLSLIENFKVDINLNNVYLLDYFYFLYRYIKFTFFK